MKHKIGIVCICLNPLYWPYAKNMIDSANKFLLKDHDVEFMLWTDMPKSDDTESLEKAKQVIYQTEIARSPKPITEEKLKIITDYTDQMMNFIVDGLKTCDNITKFPTEPVEWPYPTLMRYHLFLREEEYLKKFDYVFYTDIDMLYVGEVGNEILGEGLTMAQHPGYALRRELLMPFESNPDSSAFVPRLGKYSIEGDKKVFEPMYAAGGFQGGKTEDFIKAMKVMKKRIDDDLIKNYIARWNDESHWNRYLLENPPAVFLSPAYIYPDSLINEYYVKIWGTNYEPKIITLTKKFSTSTEGASLVLEKISTL